MRKEVIYIVEDDETIIQLLKQYLGKTYQVHSVDNFRSVCQEIEELQPDLILMDISLPYYNGFYWTTEIRKRWTMPILFLSSSDDEMNAVMAMNMGGDDFISKPFSLSILDAKIAAFLRREQQFHHQTELRIDDFQLYLDGRFATSSQEVHLSPTETKILAILLQRKGQVVHKKELLEELWEKETFIDQNTLHVNLTRLRRKTAEIGFQSIHTIRGVGYLIQ